MAKAKFIRLGDTVINSDHVVYIDKPYAHNDGHRILITFIDNRASIIEIGPSWTLPEIEDVLDSLTRDSC